METNKELLDRYVELYNAGDLDACMELYAQDASQRMHDGVFEGIDAIAERLAAQRLQVRDHLALAARLPDERQHRTRELRALGFELEYAPISPDDDHITADVDGRCAMRSDVALLVHGPCDTTVCGRLI
jgi:hypothetical protein